MKDGESTGYFAVPGYTWNGKVHAVRNGKPVCGARFSQRAEYQWCAWGWQPAYITCEHCRKTASEAKP